MGTEKEKLEQLFLDNAPKLVRYTIKKNQEAIKYFGSFEDMEQSLLGKVWTAISKYDESKGKLSTYVMAVCQNAIRRQVNISKAPKRKGQLENLSLDYAFPEGTSYAEILGDNEDLHRSLVERLILERAMSLLIPESYAYYIDGLKQIEIAEVVGCSQGVVSRKIRKNIKQIRAVIFEEFEL